MTFDLGSSFATLVATWLGAYGAYRFNLKLAEKQQKDAEKAKLLKLFYDTNTLIKTFSYYYKNTNAEINNLTKSELEACTPITIKYANFKVEEYGFITELSPKLYETLTYVHHDINYVYEQQDILDQFFCQKVKIDVCLIKLEHIKVSTIKLLAKLYVSLININNILAKHYGCKNLIKDEAVNSYIRARKIIERTLKEYQEIISDSETGKDNIDKEALETIRVDYEYINEILNTWIIDFSLKNKQKTILETEINKQVQDKWEDSNNDF